MKWILKVFSKAVRESEILIFKLFKGGVVGESGVFAFWFQVVFRYQCQFLRERSHFLKIWVVF